MSPSMEDLSVAVLGSGMAAMGAAHTLREAGQTPVCFDSRDYGTCQPRWVSCSIGSLSLLARVG